MKTAFITEQKQTQPLIHFVVTYMSKKNLPQTAESSVWLTAVDFSELKWTDLEQLDVPVWTVSWLTHSCGFGNQAEFSWTERSWAVMKLDFWILIFEWSWLQVWDCTLLLMWISNFMMSHRWSSEHDSTPVSIGNACTHFLCVQLMLDVWSTH